MDASPLVVGSPERLTLALAGEYRDFQHLDDDGLPEGAGVDLWRAWARASDIELDMVLVSADAARRMLARGEVDMISPARAGRTPDADMAVSHPFDTLEFHIFSNKSFGRRDELQNLAHMSVGYVAGSVEESLLREGVPFGTVLKEYRTTHEMAMSAMRGGVDAFVCTKADGQLQLTAMQAARDFLPSAHPILNIGVGAAVLKSNASLLTFVNRGLEELSLYEMAAIQSRWSKASRAGIPWATMGAVCLALLSLLAMALLWSWQLRSRVGKATEKLRQSNKLLKQEVTQRRNAQAEALRQQAYFEQLFENSPQAIAILDENGDFSDVNKAFEDLFLYRREEVWGKNIRSLIVPEEFNNESLELLHDLNRGESVQANLIRRKKDGMLIPVSFLAYPRYSNDQTHGFFCVYSDVTEQQKAEERLMHQAFHDSLTGLPNRLLFMERLGHCIERQRRNRHNRFAVLYLDLDRFKVINDSLGHHAGDELIRSVSDKLLACVREADTVSRIGGDEFALLLEDVDSRDEVHAVADRILRIVREPVVVDGHDLHNSASIGIVYGPSGDYTAEQIMRDADIVMYQAKDSGKDQAVVFTEDMREQAMMMLRLESELRVAIEHRQFEVHYQPVVDLVEGGVKGFEALVRWRHPERGLVFPGDFIHVAEETGLVVPIGMEVLDKALGQLAQWRSNLCREDLKINVNLSPNQLLQADLPQMVALALDKNKLPASVLRLEITESVLMESASIAGDQLAKLKSLGVDISLDDFGTGYSSLSYLHQFPIDSLKIDRSFVQHMEEKEDRLEIVRTIVLMAQTLNLEVVAEGVETWSQMASLKAMGCDAGQGYYYAKPLPPDEAEAFLTNEDALAEKVAVCTADKFCANC